jgi:hypothetical protein
VGHRRKVGAVGTQHYNAVPAGLGMPATGFYLRLRRDGTVWSAWWSLDAITWNQVGGNQAYAMATTQVGIVTISTGATWNVAYNAFYADNEPIAEPAPAPPPSGLTGLYAGFSLHWRATDPGAAIAPNLRFFEAGGDPDGAILQAAPDITNWATPPGDTPPNNPPPGGRPPWAWTTQVDPITGEPGLLRVNLCYYDNYL